MEDLRIVLMILGIAAIVGLVVHGIWTAKAKNKELQHSEPASEHDIDTDSNQSDNIEAKAAKPATASKPNKTQKKRPSLKDRLITPEKPEPAASRVEPNLGEGQMEMALHDDEPVLEGLPESEIEPAFENIQRPETSTPEEVLILNVITPEGQVMSGAILLPTLLTLGFKFGEMAIFHRHEDSSGNGDVLFSLANMYNPGTFDLDNLEQFNTSGLSLFMSLPVSGEPHQVFELMHNAAKKIATEFGGQVLDGQRSVLTRQTVQHYYDRIREFERRQLIKNSV